MKKLFTLLTVVMIFILSISLYVLTLRGVAGNIKSSDIHNKLDKSSQPFELSPERGRFILTMSLGENQSFALSPELGEAARPDVGYLNGKLFIYFAPGISLLALPFYLVGKGLGLSQVASYFMISLFASFNLVLLFLISKKIFKLPTWASILAAFIYGFSSTAWSYAITLYQHQLTVFFILSSFYAVWKFRQKTTFSWLSAVWVWLCFGAAISIDYPNAFLMLPVMIYLAISSFSIEKMKEKIQLNLRLSAIIASIFFIVIIVLNGVYNYTNFGDWKKVSGSLTSYEAVLKQKKLSVQQRSEKITQLANQKNSLGYFFTEENLPKSSFTLLFSTDRGLFFYTPIFVLAFLGIWKVRRKITPELGTLLGLIGVNIFLYSSWGDPWGGWAYGARYLIPTMAYLSIFIAIWLSKKYNLGKAVIAFFLIAFSSAVALLGALTTNAVPPKIEADFYGWKYNFLFNLDILHNGQSGSFIYNTYLSKLFSLEMYYFYLYVAVIILFSLVLFILPIFNKDESHD